MSAGLGDDSIRESFNKHDGTGASVKTATRQKSGINYATVDNVKNCSPEDVIAKFNQLPAGKSDHYEDKLPQLPVPGTGLRRETCGNDIPRGCAGCGKTHTVGQTCQRRMCPRCWKNWDRRRAAMICAKMEARRRTRESRGMGWQGWKFHHLVLSPPEGFALNSDQPFDRTIQILKEVLEELGVPEGVLLYHPWRGPDGDDRGFWKHVLPDGEEIGNNTLVEEHDLQFSPHFHAVVLAKHVDGGYVTKAIEEQTGWIVDRITKGEDSDVSIYDEYDLARSVTYCLSHTGQGENRAGYRYFGGVANHAAPDQIYRDMDAAVRSVAVNTLDLPFFEVACTIDRTKTKKKTVLRPAEVSLGAAHGDGSPEMVEATIEETVEERCDGRLVVVGDFPKFINDPEWVERAEHAEEMIEAWEEWEDDEPPPDDDEPGPPQG